MTILSGRLVALERPPERRRGPDDRSPWREARATQGRGVGAGGCRGAVDPPWGSRAESGRFSAEPRKEGP